jgi:site-specific DNA-methyltransferase (adenine-specific)
MDGARVSTRANIHPTVKSVALMRWLVTLVTPVGGVVLDPFCGSGSTGVAALADGFRFAGVEREKEYYDIARGRIVGDNPLFNRII